MNNYLLTLILAFYIILAQVQISIIEDYFRDVDNRLNKLEEQK